MNLFTMPKFRNRSAMMIPSRSITIIARKTRKPHAALVRSIKSKPLAPSRSSRVIAAVMRQANATTWERQYSAMQSKIQCVLGLLTHSRSDSAFITYVHATDYSLMLHWCICTGMTYAPWQENICTWITQCMISTWVMYKWSVRVSVYTCGGIIMLLYLWWAL